MNVMTEFQQKLLNENEQNRTVESTDWLVGSVGYHLSESDDVSSHDVGTAKIDQTFDGQAADY